MNLILVETSELAGDGRVMLTGRRAMHLRDVLRAKPGDTVRVGCLNGPLGTGRVHSVQTDDIILDCVFDRDPPPPPPVDLLLALPRPKVMKRLWAPLASMGVGRILLSNAEKVERCYFDSHVLEPAFRKADLMRGLEQAVDTRLPVVTIHRRLKILIEDELDTVTPGSLRWMADVIDGRRVSLDPAVGTDSRILLAIGPEGGWSNYERDLLCAHGFEPVTMGPRILCSDTACIALLALAHARLARSNTTPNHAASPLRPHA